MKNSFSFFAKSQVKRSWAVGPVASCCPALLPLGAENKGHPEHVAYSWEPQRERHGKTAGRSGKYDLR